MHHSCICIANFISFRFGSSPSRLKPLVIDQYNRYMLGVDRLDQRMSYYHFERKTVRWWRKVFFWIVEVAMVNSYIIYTRHTDARRKLTHKDFRKDLVMALCDEQRNLRSCRHVPRRDVTLERLRGSHFPDKDQTRRDCRVCSVRGAGGQRHLTPYICSTCSDRPHLCIGECFKRYHTQTNL